MSMPIPPPGGPNSEHPSALTRLVNALKNGISYVTNPILSFFSHIYEQIENGYFQLTGRVRRELPPQVETTAEEVGNVAENQILDAGDEVISVASPLNPSPKEEPPSQEETLGAALAKLNIEDTDISKENMDEIQRNSLAKQIKDICENAEQKKFTSNKDKKQFCNELVLILRSLNQPNLSLPDERKMLQGQLDKFRFEEKEKKKLYAAITDSETSSTPLIEALVDNNIPFSDFNETFSIVTRDGVTTEISIAEAKAIPYFERVLSSSAWIEAREKKITLPELDAEHIELMLGIAKGYDIDFEDPDTWLTARYINEVFDLKMLGFDFPKRPAFANAKEYLDFVIKNKIPITFENFPEAMIADAIEAYQASDFEHVTELTLSEYVGSYLLDKIGDRFAGVKKLVVESSLSKRGLSQIAKCFPNLEALALRKPITSPEQIEVVPEELAPLITSISIEDPRFEVLNEKVFTLLAQNLPNLQRLNLRVKSMSNESRSAVATLKDLKSLSVMKATQWTDAQVASLLANADNLTQLSIFGGDALTNGVLQTIAAKCPSLRRLSLDYSLHINEQGLNELAQGLPHLEELKFAGMFSDEFLLDIKEKFKLLSELDISSGRNLTPEGVESFLKELPQLQSVYIPHYLGGSTLGALRDTYSKVEINTR